MATRLGHFPPTKAKVQRFLDEVRTFYKRDVYHQLKLAAFVDLAYLALPPAVAVPLSLYFGQVLVAFTSAGLAATYSASAIGRGKTVLDSFMTTRKQLILGPEQIQIRLNTCEESDERELRRISEALDDMLEAYPGDPAKE